MITKEQEAEILRLHHVEKWLVGTMISDNYSCRATTITPAGRRRPEGSCDAA